MSDVDMFDLCYRDGTHGDVVHVEKKAEDSFQLSNIAEVLVVVHFSTKENYEYSLEADNGGAVDAVAQEWWEWQQRYLYYRVDRGKGVTDSGVGALRRVFQDRLCHWTREGEAPPSNSLYPALSIWSAKPGVETQDYADAFFNEAEGCFSSSNNVLEADLNADETDRTDSYGDSGLNYFHVLTDGARAAAEAAGCDPDDLHSLWNEYSYCSGGVTHYGQEPVIGVSGFGIAFKDGSCMAQSSTMPNEISGNGVFQNVMARFLEELTEDEAERANLMRLLADPELETRLQGLELLAALG